jgi:hypothetical protein
MNLYPWDEVIVEAERRLNKGFNVYQQFNCAKCGAKQTMEVPNTFYRKGTCEECRHMTDIEKDGHNYMAISKNV